VFGKAKTSGGETSKSKLFAAQSSVKLIDQNIIVKYSVDRRTDEETWNLCTGDYSFGRNVSGDKASMEKSARPHNDAQPRVCFPK
jgi:hypothetical protein